MNNTLIFLFLVFSFVVIPMIIFLCQEVKRL